MPAMSASTLKVSPDLKIERQTYALAVMFNALNRFMSRLDGGDQQLRQHEQGSYGFQVLRNTSVELAVEPWFDFIVRINGRPLDNLDASLFAQEIRNCSGNSVSLGLWNAKGQRTREMHVPVSRETALLGLALQWSPIALAANVWHVLDVAQDSPADNAALLPYSDYILGSLEGALHGESALGELVEDYICRPLRLYVYNNEYDITREVTIQPSRDWGGEGALGCVLGYGALHRLPAPLSEPVNAPGETLFDGDVNEKSDEAFVPADSVVTTGPGRDYLGTTQATVATAPSTVQRSWKKRERAGQDQTQLMNDYLKEEQKSLEVDNAPRVTGSKVPPPPKVSDGPPKAEAKSEEVQDADQARRNTATVESS